MKLCELLESVPDAMVIINQDGGIALVNAQRERLFGYSREELLGQTIEILMPERCRGKHIEHRAGYCVAPHVCPLDAGMELRGLRRHGSEFPAEISLSPLQTDEGLWVTSTIRDISERKQVETTLRKTHEELELWVAGRTADLQISRLRMHSCKQKSLCASAPRQT